MCSGALCAHELDILEPLIAVLPKALLVRRAKPCLAHHLRVEQCCYDSGPATRSFGLFRDLYQELSTVFLLEEAVLAGRLWKAHSVEHLPIPYPSGMAIWSCARCTGPRVSSDAGWLVFSGQVLNLVMQHLFCAGGFQWMLTRATKTPMSTPRRCSQAPTSTSSLTCQSFPTSILVERPGH